MYDKKFLSGLVAANIKRINTLRFFKCAYINILYIC